MSEHKEFIPFRFEVSLFAKGSKELLCRGLFSEVSGLELTMEPRAIQVGGQNWGEVQRVGQTKFSPIVLKRGVTDLNHLWSWFDTTTRGANYGFRLEGEIKVLANVTQPSTVINKRKRDTEAAMIWQLSNVLPTRFKGPDLSSTANQVAIEEVTLVHESLTLVQSVRQASA